MLMNTAGVTVSMPIETYEEIKIFNEVIINSDEKLLKYCNLFNLIPKNTDCIELIKIIYNNSYYKINNGKVIINNSIPNNIILNTDGLIHKNCIDPRTGSYSIDLLYK